MFSGKQFSLSDTFNLNLIPVKVKCGKLRKRTEIF